jgi:hypothetical protein
MALVHPAARKRRTGQAPIRTKFWSGFGRSGQRLPAICHACGIPTRSAKRLSAASEPQDTTIAPGVGGFIAHLIKPFDILNMMERHHKTVVVSLVLPTCEQCARNLPNVTPHYIDFDEHRVDLVVHVEFKKAMDYNGPG